MIMLLDANGALLAAAAGLLLICAEFCLPGYVIPGVLGGVCLCCGIFRLSTLDANAAVAAVIVFGVAATAAAGYGLLPSWLGISILLSIPWLFRLLVPGAIQWPVAMLSAAAPTAIFLLLRVAARAVANKTLIQ